MKTCISIVPINYESIKNKGISLDALYDEDVGGYFKKVYHVHFVSNFEQEIRLNKGHFIIEYQLKNKNIFSKSLHFFKVLFKMKKRFENENIDLIVAHDPIVSSLFAYFLSKFLNSKWVIKIVSNYDLTYKQTGQLIYPFLKFKFIENIIARFAFKRASAILCLSKDNKYYVLKYNNCEEKIYVLRGMGCNLNFKDDINEEKVPTNILKYKNSKYVLYVGRLSPEKYPEDFCKIAERLSSLNIKFLIAGDGVLRNFLEKKYKDTENLIFLGFVNQDTIKFLNKNAYLVFAPLSGCSLIESAKMEANVITYDIEWHTEIVIDDYSGKVFNYRDWISVSNYINDIYQNKLNIDMFGRNLKRIVEVLFDKRKLIEQEKKIYEDII